MPTLSLVITLDDGKKEVFELSPAGSRVLQDQICMGTSPEKDLAALTGGADWTDREGLDQVDLLTFKTLFVSLRRAFAK